MLPIGIRAKAWWKPKAHVFKMENIILKNMKIKTIMENMSNTLEEMKIYVNEIIEEKLEKVVLVYLKERGFRQNKSLFKRNAGGIPLSSRWTPRSPR
jgi:hypothetical protein